MRERGLTEEGVQAALRAVPALRATFGDDLLRMGSVLKAIAAELELAYSMEQFERGHESGV